MCKKSEILKCGKYGNFYIIIGTCVFENNKTYCKCDVGYIGEYCDIRNCFKNNICGDNGICIEKKLSIKCSCNKGWKGNTCERMTCDGYDTCPHGSNFDIY